jgi:serine/threonine-protein kinase
MQARLAQFGRIGMTIAICFFCLGLAFHFSMDLVGIEGALAAQAASAVVGYSVWAGTRRKILSPPLLAAIDVVATLSNVAIFMAGPSLVPLWARPELLQLLLVTDVLVLRAFLVPSTARRTALLGGVAALGITISTAYMYAGQKPHPEAPDAIAYVAIAAFFGLGMVLVTALTSRTIFGLRQRVREATELGQYTLLEKIGEGGMGIVFKARHAMLRRPTAIKLLPVERAGEHNLARFEREVQMTSVLTHPNTVSIYDYGRTSSGTLYYAMEYLDGIDLEALVAIAGPQEPGRVIHLLRQACGALGEAHEVGLIHRDVKPANLLLCSRAGNPDLIKVLDFGLVKSIGGPRDAAETAANQLVGTPLYLSPESIVTPGKMDARSDLYALGALGYFLLVGQPPFTATSAVEVCGHHLHTQPVAPAVRLGRAATLRLDELILWCLEKSPDARPPNAEALSRALDTCDDVPAWSAEQARAWWETHAPAIRARRAKQDAASGHDETIEVDLRLRAFEVAS